MEMSGRGKELEKNVQREEKNSLFLNVTVTSGGTVAKNLPANEGNTGNISSIPGLGRFPWRMKWQPTQYSLHAKFHGQRSLAGSSHGVTKSWTQLSLNALLSQDALLGS